MKRVNAFDTKYIIVDDSSLEAGIVRVVSDYRESVLNSLLIDNNLQNYLKKKFMIEAKQELIDQLVIEFKASMKMPVDIVFYKPILDKIRDDDNVMLIPESILFYREVESIIKRHL